MQASRRRAILDNDQDANDYERGTPRPRQRMAAGHAADGGTRVWASTSRSPGLQWRDAFAAPLPDGRGGGRVRGALSAVRRESRDDGCSARWSAVLHLRQVVPRYRGTAGRGRRSTSELAAGDAGRRRRLCLDGFGASGASGSLHDAFDFVATRDDVEYGKPNPEIYHLVADELGVSSEHCLVIEDSPSGVKAALNANMHVMAVATPFTKEHLKHVVGLPSENLVLDPNDVLSTAKRIIEEANSG